MVYGRLGTFLLNFHNGLIDAGQEDAVKVHAVLSTRDGDGDGYDDYAHAQLVGGHSEHCPLLKYLRRTSSK